nr:MFS transporter [Sphingomonas jejuensis]
MLGHRRFLPLFVTQLLGAFNDNLYKTVMVLFVTFHVYNDVGREVQFNAVATGLFILPFFLLSALSGQLADTRDKARIIRLVKTAEIFIMLVGAAGLLLANVPVMLAATLAMGIHSTFFGPIKYAILPQHLEPGEVLGGTGLVEAGTYLAILAGTIVAGLVSGDARLAAAMVLGVAALGWLTARQVPPAPPLGDLPPLDFHVVRSSIRLVSATMHVRRLFLAILSISFFWAIGAVLIIQFPPLVKNVLTADERVASLFLGIFSVGVAIGSVIVNRLLKGEVSARWSPVSVLAMGGFILMLSFVARGWEGTTDGSLYGWRDFMGHPGALLITISLLGVSIAGGMFVVPLYAFLTTTVEKDQTARTVAANNIVNSGAMVVGSLLAFGISLAGVGAADQLLLTAAMCLVSAWLATRLNAAVAACPLPLGQATKP